jgi:hypothetical protein
MLHEPKSPSRRSQSTHSSDETGESRWSEGVQEGRCEMTRPTKQDHAKAEAPVPKPKRDYIPVTVPFAATQAGETSTIDQWAHRAVWTDRMLDTLLQNKVRGGKWHTLFDKVFSELNLFCSAGKVTGKRSRTSTNTSGRNSSDLATNCETEPVVPQRCFALGFPSRAVRRNDRWLWCGNGSRPLV